MMTATNLCALAEAGEHEREAAVVPAVPAWFLSAVAPPSMEEETSRLMMRLSWHAREQFVRQGNAPAAWATLEPGILQACHSILWKAHCCLTDLIFLLCCPRSGLVLFGCTARVWTRSGQTMSGCLTASSWHEHSAQSLLNMDLVQFE